jgi:hypothetical protein
MDREAAQQNAEIDAQLQVRRPRTALNEQVLCPKRDVRDFRIVRVVDATGDRPAKRVGMLKVWDASAMGKLEEGQRYMVSGRIRRG